MNKPLRRTLWVIVITTKRSEFIFDRIVGATKNEAIQNFLRWGAYSHDWAYWQSHGTSVRKATVTTTK